MSVRPVSDVSPRSDNSGLCRDPSLERPSFNSKLWGYLSVPGTLAVRNKSGLGLAFPVLIDVFTPISGGDEGCPHKKVKGLLVPRQIARSWRWS